MFVKKIFIFLALLLLAAGCQKAEKKGSKQVLRLNIHTEPPNLDSRKATDTTSIFVIKLFREGLMKRGFDGKSEFDIAKGVDISEDGLTYTFYLRESNWSNGTPLTARDFEKSWKTVLDPNFACEHAHELYKLKNSKKAKEEGGSLDDVGVKALDDLTLQVTLEHPVPYFLSLTSTPFFFPSQEKFDPYISNGPFKLVKWRHFDELVLVKNPLYWDKEKVRLDKVRLFVIEDDHTELNLFENGELDWAGHPFATLPTEALTELEKRETIYKFPLDAVYYYIFNTRIYPLNNANLRKALSLSINRKEIVDNITQMQQEPTYSLIPQTMWDDVPHSQKAKEFKDAQHYFQLALKELGITHEEFPTLTLTYNTTVGHHKIAQAIQQQWKQSLGINIKLENKDWKVFLDDTMRGQFQIARCGGVASINDPITFLDEFRFTQSARNRSCWCDPTFLQLIEQAELTIDPKKRLNLLRNAEDILISEMPIAPIFIYTGCYIKKPYVKNVLVSSLGDMDLKGAYIDYDEKTSD